MRRVLELIQLRRCESGQIIFNKGEQSENAYILLFGEAYLYDREEAPSTDELDLASRSNATNMKKIKVGGLLG